MVQFDQSSSQSELVVNPLYKADFHAWTQEQAELLRTYQWSQLDLPNLVEEIESLGKQQRAELRNRLSVLVGHLLKWEYQSEKPSRSWLATIRVQRMDILELLEENPSLKPYLQAGLENVYRRGVALAAGETNLSERRFPDDSPYTLVQILDNNFYPGKPSDWVEE